MPNGEHFSLQVHAIDVNIRMMLFSIPLVGFLVFSLFIVAGRKEKFEEKRITHWGYAHCQPSLGTVAV